MSLTRIMIIILCVTFLAVTVAVLIKGSDGSGRSPFRSLIITSLLIFYVTGILCFGNHVLAQDRCLLKTIYDFSRGSDMEITVRGRVAEHVRSYGDRISFSMKTEEIAIKDIGTGNCRTMKAGEVIPVSIRTDSRNILARDDFFSFRCQVKKSRDFYYLYGYDTGIERITPGRTKGILFELRSRTYNCIKCLFYLNLEYGSASLSESVILGNTGNLPDRVSSDFKRSGIYHLLAISGLHISFFILIISTFLNFFASKKLHGKKGDKWTGFAGMMIIVTILIFYNFLIGGKASTVRSTVMSVYFLLAAGAGREVQGKTVLSYVFILLLVINPVFFTEVGFWLTFTAVFAILYANRPLTEFAASLKKKLLQVERPYNYESASGRLFPGSDYFMSILVTTFSVNMFILPVLLYVFQEASLLSVLTNLLAIPVFYILLFILIISSVLGLIWPPAGGITVRCSEILIRGLEKIAGLWRFFRFTVIESRDIEVIHLIIYYIFLLSVLIIISGMTKKWNGRKLRE